MPSRWLLRPSEVAWQAAFKGLAWTLEGQSPDARASRRWAHAERFGLCRWGRLVSLGRLRHVGSSWFDPFAWALALEPVELLSDVGLWVGAGSTEDPVSVFPLPAWLQSLVSHLVR